MIYAGTFRKPDPTFVLKRGDPTQKMQEVGPAGVRAVAPAFELKPDAAGGGSGVWPWPTGSPARTTRCRPA